MTRALSPLVGTVLLAGVTVLLAALLGLTVLDAVPSSASPEPVVISASANSDGRIELVHEAGPTLDVRDLSIRLAVDGEPLAFQPPVPFFSANGFAPGPTGPFNVATDPDWEQGERATVTVAATNEPTLDAGTTLTVRIDKNELPVAEVETRIDEA